jgi:L-threonylcarbamoyladenylate synthase
MCKIIKIDANDPDPKKIREAAKIIKAGGIVAFPTETVYGIGAGIFNKEAINKIYKIKGRSRKKPLQILLDRPSKVKLLANKLSKKAKELMKKYWPGPMTLVLFRSRMVPSAAVAGQNTVGIRIPDHKVILELIKASGTPIAATSANRSGMRPPVTAGEVMSNLKDDVDLILDGGKTKLGIPSTVIDATKKSPKVLRGGSIHIKK